MYGYNNVYIFIYFNYIISFKIILSLKIDNSFVKVHFNPNNVIIKNSKIWNYYIECHLLFYYVILCFRMSSVLNSGPVVGMRRWAISIEYLINDPEGKYYCLLYYYYFPK